MKKQVVLPTSRTYQRGGWDVCTKYFFPDMNVEAFGHSMIISPSRRWPRTRRGSPCQLGTRSAGTVTQQEWLCTWQWLSKIKIGKYGTCQIVSTPFATAPVCLQWRTRVMETGRYKPVMQTPSALYRNFTGTSIRTTKVPVPPVTYTSLPTRLNDFKGSRFVFKEWNSVLIYHVTRNTYKHIACGIFI
jgi:hypothetical protein